MRKLISIVILIVIVLGQQLFQNTSDTELTANEGADTLAEAFDKRLNDTWVEAGGQVVRLLPDDNIDSRHQRFIIETSQGQSILIAHNIDLAPRVPVGMGDKILLKGVYEWNERGGVIHWTHHDPRGQEPGGFISHQGNKYE